MKNNNEKDKHNGKENVERESREETNEYIRKEKQTSRIYLGQRIEAIEFRIWSKQYMIACHPMIQLKKIPKIKAIYIFHFRLLPTLNHRTPSHIPDRLGHKTMYVLCIHV